MTDRILQEGLTFDDVLLGPAYSEVLPREVDLKCQVTRNISRYHRDIEADVTGELAFEVYFARKYLRIGWDE